MIIFFVTLLIIFCTFLGAISYVLGHKDGYIDGKLDEKWRKRDERKNKDINSNI